MEVCYDLPDIRRCMLAAEQRSGNQIFAHRQSATFITSRMTTGRGSGRHQFGAGNGGQARNA
jgi:hypothetical protein